MVAGTIAVIIKNMHTENITYSMALIQKIIAHFNVKAVLAFFYVSLAFFFDGLQKEAILAIIVLVVFDFITGIVAAKVVGEEIRSAKVFRSAMKLVAYLMLISAGHFAEKAFPIISSFADETILAFLAVTELISNIENAGKMGFGIPRRLLNKLEHYRDSF